MNAEKLLDDLVESTWIVVWALQNARSVKILEVAREVRELDYPAAERFSVFLYELYDSERSI